MCLFLNLFLQIETIYSKNSLGLVPFPSKSIETTLVAIVNPIRTNKVLYLLLLFTLPEFSGFLFEE